MFKSSRNLLIQNSNFHQSSTYNLPGVTKGFDILVNSVAPNAFHNSDDRPNLPKCHENTRVTVIDKIMDWIMGEIDIDAHALFLWLYGPAECGKTAIARTVAEQCEELDLLLASFFFFRTDPQRNTLKSFVASVVYRIALVVPASKPIIECVVEMNPLIFQYSLETQWRKLVCEPLQKLLEQGHFRNTPCPPLIIIDGLDECLDSGSQIKLISALVYAMRRHRLPLRVLIASRPEQHLEYAFSALKPHPIVFYLQLTDEYRPDEDIRRFLIDKFDAIKRSHPLANRISMSPWPSEEQVEFLVRKSSGQFVFASGIARFVDSPRHLPSQRLDVILDLGPPECDLPFSELDHLYECLYPPFQPSMEARTGLLQSSLPRSINRSASPLPKVTIPTSESPATSPRPYGQRSSLASSPSAAQPEINRTVTPTSPAHPLSIPRPSNSKPSAPKIKLQVNVTSTSGPLFESYAGGPGGERLQTVERTIQPKSMTLMPAHKTDVVNALRKLVAELEAIRIELPSASFQPSRSGSAASNTFSDADFEEMSRLGEGPNSAVHKVRHIPTGIIMARKTITAHEAPRRQLERELSVMASAQHVNVIKWHGAYMTPASNEIKILMEHCGGGSLDAVGKRIRERGAIVGERVAGRLAEGILQGLAYLHSKKTIHRDIKPSNILLSRGGVVKLCDFGVSGELVRSLADTFTGTSSYMAPERIGGHEYTIRSDVWSTGISLLELAQNRFPFPRDLPLIELMMYISTGDPPKLEDEHGVQWSGEMKDFIKQTLIIDGATRPTPREMLSHPWIIISMQQQVHMAWWIRQVWGWPQTPHHRDERLHAGDC